MQLNLSGKQYRQLRAALYTSLREAMRFDRWDHADNLKSLLDYLQTERERSEQDDAEAWRKYGEDAFIVKHDEEKRVTCKLEDPYCSCNRRG